MRFARALNGLAVLVVLVLVSAAVPMPGHAQQSVLNYFASPGSGRDNVLNLDGTLEFEDKATVIDHGTTTLVNGYKSITTNLSSNVSCRLQLKGAATPSASTVLVQGLWTTGSAVLEIVGPAGSTADVGWDCFGDD